MACAACEVIGAIHDRMPVILDEKAAEDCMNHALEKDALSLNRPLMPPPFALLVMRLASPLANSVKNNGPMLVKGK